MRGSRGSKPSTGAAAFYSWRSGALRSSGTGCATIPRSAAASSRPSNTAKLVAAALCGITDARLVRACLRHGPHNVERGLGGLPPK